MGAQRPTEIVTKTERLELRGTQGQKGERETYKVRETNRKRLADCDAELETKTGSNGDRSGKQRNQTSLRKDRKSQR